MNNIIEETFCINGMNCTIETTDGGDPKHDTLRVIVNNREITDSWGESPMNSAYQSRGLKFSRVHGAARRSMIKRILRECVVQEIQAHEVFCLQLVEDGEIDAVTGEER